MNDKLFLTEEQINLLKEFLNKDANVDFALVFGSYAKEMQKKESDLDVAIYFENPLEGVELLRYINRLSELAGKEVDIAVLNRASAFLRHQVMKYSSPLIIKNHLTYIRFREKTMIDYDEYRFVSGMCVYDR
ncbi:MAG: nucleotidyltransferase domain-containing protein [Nitrospirota bacterium]